MFKSALLYRFFFSFLFCFTSVFIAFCQEDLSGDMPFFQKRAMEYQEWLMEKGLGKLIQVDHVQFKMLKNGQQDKTELELILVLRTNDLDTAVGQWNSMKKSFDTPVDSIEAFLYRSFVHKMEINPEKGNIQIYLKDSTGKYLPCFYIWIWWSKGEIITQKKLNDCKAKTFDIFIPPYKINHSGRIQSTKVIPNKIKTPNEVFNAISTYLRVNLLLAPRYKTILKDRKPIIEDSLRVASHFEFVVANLGKEVLTDQSRSAWEKWVGINTIAMERLSFQFDYIPNQDGSFNLKCIIDGKYGSGVFKPRKSAYINMEDDFEDFFETYKVKLRQALIKLLSI